MELPPRHEDTKNEITITYDDIFRNLFSLFHTLAFTELIFSFVSLRVLVPLWRFFFFIALSGFKFYTHIYITLNFSYRIRQQILMR